MHVYIFLRLAFNPPPFGVEFIPRESMYAVYTLCFYIYVD